MIGLLEPSRVSQALQNSVQIIIKVIFRLRESPYLWPGWMESKYFCVRQPSQQYDIESYIFTLSRSRSGRQVLYDSLCPGSLSKVQLYIDTDIGEVKELIVIVSKSHHDMGVLSASLWWMGARQRCLGPLSQCL